MGDSSSELKPLNSVTRELNSVRETNRRLLLELAEKEEINEQLQRMLRQSQETTQQLRVGLSRAITTISDFEEFERETKQYCAKMKQVIQEKVNSMDNDQEAYFTAKKDSMHIGFRAVKVLKWIALI